MKKYSIYKLVNPITGDVFYIGMTSRSLKLRLSGHITGAKTYSGCNSELDNYVRKILDKGLKPTIELVCETKNKADESKYISKFSNEYVLYNAAQVKERKRWEESQKYQRSQEIKKAKRISKILKMSDNELMSNLFSSAMGDCKKHYKKVNETNVYIKCGWLLIRNYKYMKGVCDRQDSMLDYLIEMCQIKEKEQIELRDNFVQKVRTLRTKIERLGWSDACHDLDILTHNIL